MISGDELIMTRKGLHVNQKSLESIGIFEGSQVYLFPMQTFEFRDEQPSAFFPMDLIITPIAPKRWPFVMRFVLYLNNKPGMLYRASKLFSKLGINIIFTESTRSGHHHVVVNTLGEIIRLEVKYLEEIYEELKIWKNDRSGVYKSVYDTIYNNDFFESDWSSLFKEMAVDNACIFENENLKNDVNGKNNINNSEKAFPEPLWWVALEAYANKKNEIFINKLNEDLLNSEKWEIKRKICNAEKNFDCYEGKNRYNQKLIQHAKLIGTLIAFIEQELPKNKRNIKDLLEYTIGEATPQVTELEELNNKNIIDRKELYRKVENVMLIPKMLLTVILTYKRMLCEKYKLLFIWDSLQGENMKKGDELGNTPPEVYLYNIRYYKYLLAHPYFCEKTIFTSRSKKTVKENEEVYLKENRIRIDYDFWKNKIIDIINGLDNLPPDRKGPLSWNPRLDLDPVTITSVESLSHAYYHQAYEKGFKSKCNSNFIPFNDGPYYPDHFIAQVLPESNSSTVAVASINTDSLTMRICPLNTRSIDSFRKISFSEYKRNCNENCHENKVGLTNHDLFFMENENANDCNDNIIKKYKFTDSSLSAFYEKIISVVLNNILKNSNEFTETDNNNSNEENKDVRDLISIICKELNRAGLKLPENLKEKIRNEVINLVGNFIKENVSNILKNDREILINILCENIRTAPIDNIIEVVCKFFKENSKIIEYKNNELLKLIIKSINDKIKKLLITNEEQYEYFKCLEKIINNEENLTKIEDLRELLLKEKIEARTRKDYREKIKNIVIKANLFKDKNDKCIETITELLLSISDKSVMDVCMESSIGLASLVVKAINEQNNLVSSDGIKNNINIWRTYNKIYTSNSEGECGSMDFLIQATERQFKGISKDLAINISNLLNCYIKNKFPSNHIEVSKISVNKISAGKVFIAMPFSHPASENWLAILKETGLEYGFTEVDTVKEYLDPITKTVAEEIKKSHALIQVLALPVEKASQRRDKYFFDAAKLAWVNAEYLTAISLNLKVIRIVDEISIDENEINIGKDHAAYHFSSIKPDDFKTKANDAFKKLREELTDTLGLSQKN